MPTSDALVDRQARRGRRETLTPMKEIKFTKWTNEAGEVHVYGYIELDDQRVRISVALPSDGGEDAEEKAKARIREILRPIAEAP
jgi:hypothetical protein